MPWSARHPAWFFAGAVLLSAAAAAPSNANEVRLDKGVIAAAVADPAATRALLRAAIGQYGGNTQASVVLISLFADEIGDIASCDADQAKELAAGLQAVLNDPANAILAVQPAVTEAEEDIAAAQTGPPPAGAFGSFGSSAGTGVGTSPAS